LHIFSHFLFLFFPKFYHLFFINYQFSTNKLWFIFSSFINLTIVSNKNIDVKHFFPKIFYLFSSTVKKYCIIQMYKYLKKSKK